MSNLSIKVEVYGGAKCRDAIREMAALATKLQVDVCADVSCIEVIAVPFCDGDALADAWQKELAARFRASRTVTELPKDSV